MPGSARLRDCQILQNITKKQAEAKRLYAAICAAPAVTLLPWGLLKRKQVIPIGLILLISADFIAPIYLHCWILLISS